MRVRRHGTAASFRTAAGALLARDEPRHNLIYAIASALDAVPPRYREFVLLTAETDGETVGAALMTPPWNLLVAEPTDPLAIDALARELATGGPTPPGVTAALPEAEAFAEAWRRETGSSWHRRMAQGVYRMREPRLPPAPPGTMREATDADVPLLIDWVAAFLAEAQPGSHERPQEVVEHKRQGRGGFVLWEDDGVPACCAGFGGETPTGIRVGPVYTPPALRGRGYGTALVGRLGVLLRERDFAHCFLYTNLENADANRIYVEVGYEWVCESADIALTP